MDHIRRLILSLSLSQYIGGPQRPQHQQGLKEQSDCSSAIAIQSEGIDVVDVLRDVSGKDCDEEEGSGEYDKVR